MKKFTKFLPILMALMLVSPAYADYTTNSVHSADSTMTLTLPEFISIKKTSSVESAQAQYDADYTTLTTDNTMNAVFHVITNVPNKVIYLKGTCNGEDGDTPALYSSNVTGANDMLNLVFANQTVKPTTKSIQNITSGTAAAEQNANAVSFTLKPVFTYDKDSTGAEISSVNYELGKVTYTIQNGIYDVTYTLGQTALANTFSTKDTQGEYKATITLTDVNP